MSSDERAAGPHSPLRHIRPVTIQLKGTLYRSLWGKRVFQGTVFMHGTTAANRHNGRFTQLVFNPSQGANMIYIGWRNQTIYDYGVVFANGAFNHFAILEYQSATHGWTANGGLVIAAPVRSRPQAVRMINQLVGPAWNGHLQ